MQRVVVALLITSAFSVSGCSRIGPWNLVQKDASSWSAADLDYVVQQEELEQNLEEADQIRAEKEALAMKQNSPGILSKVEPIDPADLEPFRPEESVEMTANAFQLANNNRRLSAEKASGQQQPTAREIVVAPERVVKPEIARPPVAVEYDSVSAESNPLQPRSIKTPAGTVESQVVINAEPPSQLVAHPLRPLTEKVPQLGTQWHGNGQADDSLEEVSDVEIKRLPPMIYAAPPKLPGDSNQLTPKSQSPPEFASVEWGSTEKLPVEQIQLVSWEQDAEEQDVEKKALQDAQEASQDDVPMQESAEPAKDEFTNEDFYIAGWCQQPDCQESCVCPTVESIAAEFDSSLSEALPAQFQAQEGPRWELPKATIKLIPSPATAMRVASAEPILPGGAKVSKPTRLPIPFAGDFRSATVTKANANEVLENSDLVTSNDDFRPVVGRAPKATLTWRQHLDNTIRTIQGQVNGTTDMSEREQLQGKLELLRLLPSELDERQHQYLNALTELLQSTANPAAVSIYETGQTLDQLRGAVSYLETIAGMKVVNANFCSKVAGFGQFELMDRRVFEAGQTVLIYCEIENHSSQPKTVQGQAMSSTQLAGSYIVYDSNQRVVQQQAFPAVEDLARQRRRDFYMHLPFVVGDLPAGKYTYQLMVDDIGGGKSASLESALEFEVK